MSNKPSKTICHLVSKSAEGDADAMFTLAKLIYWQYEKSVSGLQNAEQLFELLAAAGAAGDAKLNREIGNFCRREFKEKTAQQYYTNAFEKELVSASEQDPKAQYAVACHYAYGEGVTQSDEKAAFWCALAARGGHEEAIKMLQNFAFEDNGIQIPSLKELENLKNDFFAIEAKREVLSNKIDHSSPKSIKVTDVSATLHRRTVNGLACTLSKVVGVAAIAYIVLSLLSFIGVMASGYNAGDGSNWIADICYSLLGTPLKLALRWEGYEMAQINAELLLQLYSFGFIGAVIVAVLLVGLWFVVIPILLFVKFKLVITLLLWYVVIIGAVLIVQKLLGNLYTYGAKIKAVPLSDSERSVLLKQLEVLEEKSTEAERRYREIYKSVELPEIDNIPQTQGDLALYFALRNIFGTTEASNAAYEFAADGDFMNGYRQYRMGRDYCKAEEYLSAAAKGDGAEAGWAAWYMAKMCREEKMPTYTFSDEKKTAAKNAEKTAETMDELASLHHCPKAVISAENIQRLIYNRDPEALLSIGKQYEQNNPSVTTVLFAEAQKAIEEIGQFGDPLRKAKWNGYDTHNMWAYYDEYKAKYDACTADIGEAAAISAAALTQAESRAKESLNALKNDAAVLKGQGLYRADELYEKIENSAGSAKRSAYQLQKQAEEARQRREEAIAKEMEKFDREADALERDVNMLFGNGFATNLERSLSGKMSNKDFLLSDDLRHMAREKLRKDAEQAYDRAQSEKE